jgi:hypothetical protein
MTPQEGDKLSRLRLTRFDVNPVAASSIFFTTVTGIASMGLMPGLAR